MASRLFIRVAVLGGLALGTLVAMPQIFAQFEPQSPEVAITGSIERASVQLSNNAADIRPEPEMVSYALERVTVIDPTATEVISAGAMIIARSSDRVEFKGGISTLEDRDALVGSATLAFPTSAIAAQLVQEPTVLKEQRDAALVAIAALSRLAEGRAEISGTEIKVTGRALFAQIPAILSARLADEVPEGWTVSLDIDAPEGATANGGAQCQQSVVARLAEDQISFAVAAASLAPDAEPLLDELAEILGQCPNVAVEVAGHTDSDGSEAANRRLSQERAAVVRQALAERGVEAERISAVGYGQAQPIAPNDTPENKARNRRIELIVID